jgi:hypothetical protein
MHLRLKFCCSAYQILKHYTYNFVSFAIHISNNLNNIEKLKQLQPLCSLGIDRYKNGE